MAEPLLYKTTGIILKRFNIAEGDKLLTVFCKQFGKRRFIAKGIRKINSRRAPHVELFSKTQFVLYRGKTLDSVRNADAIVQYGSSLHDLKQVASAYVVAEIVDRLIPDEQEHDDVWKLVDSFFLDITDGSCTDIRHKLTICIDDILFCLGYKNRDSTRTSLSDLLTYVERIIERKLRSIKLVAQAGMY